MSWMSGDNARRRIRAGKTLPDGLTVEGSLYLRGCTSLTALPEGLTVGGCLYLDNVMIGGHDITISVTLPESVIAALPGRRLRDLLDHPLLTHPDVLDTVIVRAEHQEGFVDDNVNFLMLSVDRHLGEILRGLRPAVAEAA